MYKNVLKNINISAESYTTQRLKLRMKNYFQQDIVFHQPQDQSKPELVYSSSVSLEDVIISVFNQSASKLNTTYVCPPAKTPEDND